MVDDFMNSPWNINYSIPEFDYAGQRKEQADYIKGLTEKISGFEPLTAMYNRYQNQLGIPMLREQTQRLGEASDDITSELFALPENVAGRTRESLVTAPQKERIVAAESVPLRNNLIQLSSLAQKFGNRLSAAETELGNRMKLTQAEQTRELLPWETKSTFLQQMQAREFSGYTWQNEKELDRLIANQKAGLAWTDAERNRAQELAVAEQNYKNTLKLNSYLGYGDVFELDWNKEIA